MKAVLLFVVIACSISANAVDINEIRTLFEQASEYETKNNRLIEETKKYSLSQSPLFYAYHAAGIMALANHTYWPLQKLNYFNEGKEKLEAAIKRDPYNVEIRFIRYSIQKNAPSFLGYYSKIESDKKYILSNLHQSTWSESYKSKVKKSLNG